MNLEEMNKELLEEVTSLKNQNLNLSKKNKELKKQCSIHNVSHSYILGERDETGFCDLYRDGEKTNVRMLTFTPEQVKNLQDIADKIYRENNCG